MKPLTKTDWVNLPLSIPVPWRELFDTAAQTLGISRNAALCIALKLGGPLLHVYIQVMKDELKREHARIEAGVRSASEILGSPAEMPGRGMKSGNERRTRRPEPG